MANKQAITLWLGIVGAQASGRRRRLSPVTTYTLSWQVIAASRPCTDVLELVPLISNVVGVLSIPFGLVIGGCPQYFKWSWVGAFWLLSGFNNPKCFQVALLTLVPCGCTPVHVGTASAALIHR